MSKENEFSEMFLALGVQGIKAVSVFYEGGGDSGAIESIICTTDDSTANDWSSDPESVSHYDDTVKGLVDFPGKYETAFHDMCYRHILDHVSDWYNNEGGYGNIIVSVPSGEFFCKNSIRITEIETEDYYGNIIEHAASSDKE